MKHSKRPPTQTPADAEVAAVMLELRNVQSLERDCWREMSAAHGDPQKRERIEELGRERVRLEAVEGEIQDRLRKAHDARYRHELARRGAEWRTALRETGLAVIRLQGLNRKREKLSKDIRGKSVGGMPGDVNSAILLGTGTMNCGADAYLKSLIKSGVLTENDIAQVRAEVGEG